LYREALVMSIVSLALVLLFSPPEGLPSREKILLPASEFVAWAVEKNSPCTREILPDDKKLIEQETAYRAALLFYSFEKIEREQKQGNLYLIELKKAQKKLQEALLHGEYHFEELLSLDKVIVLEEARERKLSTKKAALQIRINALLKRGSHSKLSCIPKDEKFSPKLPSQNVYEQLALRERPEIQIAQFYDESFEEVKSEVLKEIARAYESAKKKREDFLSCLREFLYKSSKEYENDLDLYLKGKCSIPQYAYSLGMYRRKECELERKKIQFQKALTSLRYVSGQTPVEKQESKVLSLAGK
jgi:hypothetical protein